MSFEAAFIKLNTSQKEAVTSTEGYLRVNAAPGTGKTRPQTKPKANLNSVSVSCRRIHMR